MTTLIDEQDEDETAGEREARLATTYTLDEVTQETVDFIIERMLIVIDEMSGHPLYEYQTPFARRFLESLIIGDGATITALWARQSGKALSLDTPIPTPNGWVNQGDLRPGDKVFSPDGKPIEVTHVHPIEYGRPCYRLTFDDKTSIIADERHEWVLKDGKTYETQALSSWKRHVRPRIAVAGAASLEDVNLPIPPYTLGAWLGDGRRQNSDITNIDLELIATIRNDGFEVTARGGTSKYAWSVKGLQKPLRVNGLLYHPGWGGRKPLHGHKHIPLKYLRASIEQRKALLRGIMDSDGYVDKTGRIELVTIDPALRDDYMELIRSLGYKVTCNEDRARLNGKDCGPRFRILFTAYKEDNVVGLTRKSERLKSRPLTTARSAAHSIREVTPVDSVPVRCITVEGGLYLAGRGWTPTHNSETISNTIAAVMVMFPVLAKVYPRLLGKFREGVWVGAFGPVDEQADNLYGRIVSRLTSESALELMADPDIQDGVKAKGRTLTLNSGSLVRKQTAHPKATIEGRTYHVILIDECQGASEIVVNKSISPMATATLGTKVFTGTPTYTKGVFYDQIQTNKREGLKKGKRQNHFEADWKAAGKANPNYYGSIQNEILRIGEDSDEFKLSYRLLWLLEAGMFTSSQRLNELGDVSMETVKSWYRTPVVVGIDPARKQDSTIVTVVYVDWDNPDEFGFYNHRILNWLDLGGTKNWETQYHRIVEFLAKYNVLRIGIDSAGVGDAVADRLKVLLPYADIVDLGSDRASQSKRWKHLYQLLDRGKITWPAGARARELKTYKRFVQEMEDLELEYTGPYMLAQAPVKSGAHDDYADSCAMACILTTDEHEMATVEVSKNFFYGR